MGRYEVITRHIDLLFDEKRSLKPKDKRPFFPWGSKMRRYKRTRDINPGRRFVIESLGGGARYVDAVQSFICDVRDYAFHTEAGNYMKILSENKVDCAEDKIRDADTAALPKEAVLSLIVWAVRAERFCEGYLEPLLLDGTMKKWLTALKEKDEA